MALPENATKELLSRGFLRLVASHSGFIVGEDESDYGSDLTLSHVFAFEEPDQRIRYSKSGFCVEVQLKATCERHVQIANGGLTYDLRAANYNDLVRRLDGNVPLILVLFVLPDDAASWLGIAETELTLRRCGYVWRPAPADEAVANVATKRITIPLANRFSALTLEALRREYVG